MTAKQVQIIHTEGEYETRWKYDSWGRVLYIVYPDREKVEYRYDRVGNVCHIEGNKIGLPHYPYIEKLQYDLYGQRVYQLDGNGVETHYQYDSLNRRLTSLCDRSQQTGQYLQAIRYGYDPVGNILHITDTGRNPRSQEFRYDDINRLIGSYGNMNCEGTNIGYNSRYTYSAAGRLLGKSVQSSRKSNALGVYGVNYNRQYNYPTSGNVFAPKQIHEQDGIGINQNGHDIFWDANGNMVYAHAYNETNERRLCWTEDNRLQGYEEYTEAEGGIAAYYNYTADGERNYKLTSPRLYIQQNAYNTQSIPLIYPTLYASALMTLTRHGYTKHYFEEGRRICSKIGGGMLGKSYFLYVELNFNY